MATAHRGKYAEKALDKGLSSLSDKFSNFCYERIPDAYASRGSMASPRAGDFAVFRAGLNYLLEVKEVDHEFRLPRANFKLDQRARMYKRELAGSLCYVLVYHTPLARWRYLPLSLFRADLIETGSWDLSVHSTISLPQVLEKLQQGGSDATQNSS